MPRFNCYKIEYIDWKGHLGTEYIFAADAEDAEYNANNIQGLYKVVSIELEYI